MDKIELIDKFLDSKGLIWVDRKIVDDKHDYELVDAKEKDFNKNKITQIPIKLKNADINFETDMVISVDLLSFFSYGIAFDMPSCFAVSDEYRDILDENNLSEEWRAFCLKNKGLIYKMEVDNFVKEQKRIASDNCHEATIRHINAIKEETKQKNTIFNILNTLQEDINTQYQELNK